MMKALLYCQDEKSQDYPALLAYLRDVRNYDVTTLFGSGRLNEAHRVAIIQEVRDAELVFMLLHHDAVATDPGLAYFMGVVTSLERPAYVVSSAPEGQWSSILLGQNVRYLPVPTAKRVA